MVAIVRCFLQQNVSLYLRPLLWDVFSDRLLNHDLVDSSWWKNVDAAVAGVQKRLNGEKFCLKLIWINFGELKALSKTTT